jgi:hypothetical protein
MPAKTGTSHALAAFASLIVGSMLSKYVWAYTPPLAEVGVTVGRLLESLTGAPLSQELTGGLVVIPALSFVWGVVYHLGRHG